MNDQNFIGDGKSGDILRGSGANVARCSLGSLGGVLSPPTSASSAFRFPPDCDFTMAGGVFDLCKTEVEGNVGWDLWWGRRVGVTGDTSGVGEITDTWGARRDDDAPAMEPEKGAVSIMGGGEGVLFIKGVLLVLSRREWELCNRVFSDSLSFPFRLALDMIFARKGFAETLLDLKMSLGLDIAVGGLVSFKLWERVSIVVFHCQPIFQSKRNTRIRIWNLPCKRNGEPSPKTSPDAS